MATREALLARLDRIAAALRDTGHGVALLGAGSTGLELDRLDAYSDLDFMAVVDAGCAMALVDDLAWLEAAHPIAYRHKNTDDGYKILFADGIFAEFGVVETSRLRDIPLAPARIIWQRPDFDPDLASGGHLPAPEPGRTPDWMIGEILTNLYVGLARYRRGEKLSALQFVQGYAMQRIVELAPSLETPRPGHVDAFGGERRFEQRFPALAGELGALLQGYERTPDSAVAILRFLEARVAVDPAMRRAILELAGAAGRAG